MQLSESFWLREFLVSQAAARAGRQIVPAEIDIANLKRLCVLVLQPLRDDLQRPILITSGLRPEWLNTLIGGSRTSVHRFGRAADFKVVGMTPLAVCRRVEQLRLPVDQCIHEFPPNGWTHVGIASEDVKPRGQYLTARAGVGRTVYELGLNA